MVALNRLILLFVACSGISLATIALAQSSSEQNATALKQYLVPKEVSALEWNLLQLNLSWLASKEGVDFVKIQPVGLDPKEMMFVTKFVLIDERWWNLPRSGRENNIQAPVEYLFGLLKEYFPTVVTNPSLFYAEFWFFRGSERGGPIRVAKFENGALVLIE